VAGYLKIVRMNTIKLLSEILAQELAPDSISKLNELRNFITTNTENNQFAELADALLQDKTIQFIFNCAKNKKRDKPNSITSEYMNTREIMAALGISRRTLAKWRTSGILTYTVYRNNCFYRIEDLKRLFEENYHRVIP
jgi:hypothetical protein